MDGPNTVGRHVECVGGPLDGETRQITGTGGGPITTGDRYAFPVQRYDPTQSRHVSAEHIYVFHGERLHHEGPQ